MKVLAYSSQREHSKMKVLPYSSQREHRKMKVLPYSSQREHSKMKVLAYSSQREHSKMNFLPYSSQREHSKMNFLPYSSQLYKSNFLKVNLTKMSVTREKMLFGNVFDNSNITTPRLINFTNDMLGRMVADNADNKFDPILAKVNPAVVALSAEVSDVDVALTLQKGATLSTDKVLTGFSFTMSDVEGAIAYALGGRSTPAYLEFYPSGIVEYTSATKTNMAMLTERVFVAATKYAAQLPPQLFNAISIFKTGWENARTDQELKKGVVKDSRGERDANRISLELALLFGIHTTAALFPGDEARCGQYFDFNLLYSNPKYKHEVFKGTIAVGQTNLVINRQLSALTAVTIRNTDANASLAVWMGPAANDPMPNTAIVINAGNSRELKPAELGASSVNTFLLIKNLHPENEGRYEVEIIGPQPKEPVDSVE